MKHSLFIKAIQVDKMPADFMSVISDFEKNRPDSIRSSHIGKLNKISIDVNDDTQLIVYQSKKNGVEQAFYVTFDNESNNCYKRDLL